MWMKWLILKHKIYTCIFWRAKALLLVITSEHASIYSLVSQSACQSGCQPCIFSIGFGLLDLIFLLELYIDMQKNIKEKR